MHIMHKARRVASTNERTARIYVILPVIQLPIVLERNIKLLLLGLEFNLYEKTERLQVHPLDFGDMCQGYLQKLLAPGS